MHAVERIAVAIRHNQYLEGADRLWNCVRPTYDWLRSIAARKGLKRLINGTDRILVAPRLRVSEGYEPEVWQHLMREVRPGDVVADVGAYIGLYTIALAKRVGPAGRVIAFEPNPVSFNALQEQVALNSVDNRVRLLQVALGASVARARFELRRDQSNIIYDCAAPAGDPVYVECLTLDNVIGNGHLDLMKIDVEGYEEKVLEGATNLLSDPKRSPRAIYIEVHPHLWQPLGTNSESLLGSLTALGYLARYLDGRPVMRIEDYGEVVAYKDPDCFS